MRTGSAPWLMPGEKSEAGKTNTTETLNTHKTNKREVVYRWHPFFGRSLTITGQRNRRGAIVFVCAPDEAKAVLEIPEWMFDTAVCCRHRPAGIARVDLSALRALRALIEGVSRNGNDVIEAQHRCTNTGGPDAQATEDHGDSVPALSADSPSSFSTWGDPSQDRSSSRPSAAPARTARKHSRLPAGGKE
jgi:hypothetical protein